MEENVTSLLLYMINRNSQVSHGGLNNTVSSMTRYAYRRIFFSVNGYYPALESIFQSSTQVNSTTMGVVGSHCASNTI